MWIPSRRTPLRCHDEKEQTWKSTADAKMAASKTCDAMAKKMAAPYLITDSAFCDESTSPVHPAWLERAKRLRRPSTLAHHSHRAEVNLPQDAIEDHVCGRGISR